MTAFSFSYAPKASTALASINPLKSGGEGLRFAANTPMSFLKQNPEIVTEGFWKGRQALTEGIVKGVTSALSGVSGALTAKAAETKADTKLAEDRAHEIAIANIKAAQTPEEKLYQKQRSDLLTQQIAAATTKNESAVEVDQNAPLEPFEMDFSQFSNLPDFKTKIEEVPAPAAPATSTAPPAAAVPATPTTAPAAPAGVSQKSIFGQSKNPNFVAFRDAIKNQSTAAAAPTEPNLFSDISAITPVPVQESAGYSLEGLQPPRQQGTLPESVGQITLSGETSQLVPVSGAEEKPLAGTPPVEPALPQAEPALAATPEPTQPTQLSEAEYRFQIENQLTARPYKSPAEANMAKKILQQKLGVKAKIDAVKGDKGSKLYYVEVEVSDEAPPAKTAPEGFFTKKITDADGKETYVYEPKVPIDQQIRSIETGIDRAKTLKQAITDIRAIAGGISPGVGGAANLMAKLPFPTDASTVQSLNETIKGIIGFKELVDLKAAGGTLGALSDAELNMLTALQGSLDVKNLHSGTYLKNLENIEKRANDVQKKLEAHQKDLMNVEKKTNFQPIQNKQLPTITTQGEYDKLKTGTEYIFKGQLKTKN
jgi:hypothetical protein